MRARCGSNSDDDGDYFTWTQKEVRALLTPEEARAAELFYDIGARGEMHHDTERNVLWITGSVEDLGETALAGWWRERRPNSL